MIKVNGADGHDVQRCLRNTYSPTLLMSFMNDSSGTKWRLTLKCYIPANSLVAEVHNYHSVASTDIIIIEKQWWN